VKLDTFAILVGVVKVDTFSCSSSDARPRFVLNRFDESVTSLAERTFPKGDVSKMSILGNAVVDVDDEGVVADATLGGGEVGDSANVAVDVVDGFAGVLSTLSRR